MESLLKRLAPNYVALAKLGEGGMGTVYRVRHRHLDDIRVAKLMRHSLRGDEKLLARFRREAQLLSGLTHPNIAQIFELFVDDEGDAAIIMEWVPGEDLRRLCRKAGPVPLATGLELGRQALAALGHLHQRQYVHRDVSPDNLMVTWAPERPQGAPGVLVKMIDLGIAKSLEDNAGMTATGNFLGKVRYSSPERLSADGRLDPRSDLYSFAVVLYEALTGHCPIQGTAPESLISGHLFRRPKSFEETDPENKIPPAVREVLLRLLSKNPEERPSSADELLRTWDTLQADFPVEADSDSPWTRHIRAATELLHEDRDAVEQTLSVTASVTASVTETVGSRWTGDAGPTRDLPDGPTSSAGEDPDAVSDVTTLLQGRPGLLTEPADGLGRAAGLMVGVGGFVALALLLVVVWWLWQQTTAPSATTDPRTGIEEAVPGSLDSSNSEAGSSVDSPADPDPSRGTSGDGPELESDRQIPGSPDEEPGAPSTGPEAAPEGASAQDRPVAARLGRWTLDATPWAELVSLTDDQGRELPLPPSPHTPLALELLEGTYTVELHSPQLETSRRLSLTVRSGDDRRQTVTFEEVEPDALLRSLGW